jgi:hypothetical protein
MQGAYVPTSNVRAKNRKFYTPVEVSCSVCAASHGRCIILLRPWRRLMASVTPAALSPSNSQDRIYNRQISTRTHQSKTNSGGDIWANLDSVVTMACQLMFVTLVCLMGMQYVWAVQARAALSRGHEDRVCSFRFLVASCLMCLRLHVCPQY